MGSNDSIPYSISRNHWGILESQHHLAVMGWPPPSMLEWYQRRPSGEPGLSLSLRSSKVTPFPLVSGENTLWVAVRHLWPSQPEWCQRRIAKTVYLNKTHTSYNIMPKMSMFQSKFISYQRPGKYQLEWKKRQPTDANTKMIDLTHYKNTSTMLIWNKW